MKTCWLLINGSKLSFYHFFGRYLKPFMRSFFSSIRELSCRSRLVCLVGLDLLCSQAFFCLNPVPNVYSTTPVEVLLELLLLTRNPSLLVLKIYGKAKFLKMLIDVDHDTLRTVLLQTPNTSHSYPF